MILVKITHLQQWGHDVVRQTTKIWCNAKQWEDATDEIARCNCIDCLDELRAMGGEAHRRIEALRRSQDPAWTLWMDQQRTQP